MTARIFICTPVALAWLLQKGSVLIPLVGMGRPENVDRNLEALRVQLDPAEMAALDAAFPIGCAAGLRYPSQPWPRWAEKRPQRRRAPKLMPSRRQALASSRPSEARTFSSMLRVS
jgi:hypothetical protein